MELAWLSKREQGMLPAARPGAELHLALPRDAAQRAALEAFIQERFAHHHQARIRHFMPCLLGLEGLDGSLHGAVGCRNAETQPLFLERYLDAPIEQVIASRLGRQVARSEIVEVGNLAADGQGSGRALIVAVTELVAMLGFNWVVFTGTRSLRNSFARLGLGPQALAPADPARIGAEAADWGTYYAQQPMVMAGEIQPSHRRLDHAGAALAHQLVSTRGVRHDLCH